MTEERKEFDCVQMKGTVQARLRSDFAGLSDEEERTHIAHELDTSDDPVARKWRRIRQGREALTE